MLLGGKQELRYLDKHIKEADIKDQNKLNGSLSNMPVISWL